VTLVYRWKCSSFSIVLPNVAVYWFSEAFCSIGPMFNSLPEVRLFRRLEFVVFMVLPSKCWTVSQVVKACRQTRCKSSAATHPHCIGLFRLSQTRLCIHFTAITSCLEGLPLPNLYWSSSRSSVEELAWPNVSLIIRFGCVCSLSRSTSTWRAVSYIPYLVGCGPMKFRANGWKCNFWTISGST